MKIFQPARRTNPKYAISFTDRDGSLKSMNLADKLQTAGHYQDGDKEHFPFTMIYECDNCM